MPRTIDEVAPFTDEERIVIRLAQESFPFFLTHVYPHSFQRERFLMADGLYHRFSLGRIHFLWAELLQTYNRIDLLAPRLHLKSTIVNHGYSFWQLFRAQRDISGWCISYKDDLASDHTKRLKRAILANPYARYWVDRKPTSDSIVDFRISFGPGEEPWHGAVEPRGILSNLRGPHPYFVVADDILSDAANPLEPKQINHITSIFNSVVASLPPVDGPLVLIGTPQSYEDILYALRENPSYVWARFSAEWERNRQRFVLWPQMFDTRRLDLKRIEIGERAYQVEYLLKPLLAVDTFLPRAVVEANVNPEIVPADPFQPYTLSPLIAGVYGGMDVGKYVHPTHISVGALTRGGHLVQIYQQFLDGMNYDAQATVLNTIIQNLRLRRMYYDATRGEMDDRKLSSKAIGVKFTKGAKIKMALALESRMFAQADDPGIVLLHDPRQTDQILAVDRTLKGIESSSGHGDSFFSVALMCQAADDGPVMETIGDAQTLFGQGGYRPNPLAATTR